MAQPHPPTPSRSQIPRLFPVLLAAFSLLSPVFPALAQEVTLIPLPGDYPETQTVKILVPEGWVLHYTLDGSTPTTDSATYSAPIPVGRDLQMRYFLLDAKGQPTPVQTAVYRIRSTSAPVVPLVSRAQPPGGTYNERVRVIILHKPGATVYFTMDDSEPDTASPIFTAPITLSTDTVLRFFSVDATGEREPVKKEVYVFKMAREMVDTTPPEVSISPSPAEYRSGKPVEFVTNEEAAVYYTVDGSEPGEGSPRYTGPISLKENTHFRFFAVDRKGNRSREREAEFVIDIEPPVTTAYPTTGLYQPPLTVRLTASEEGAVIRYTTDGSNPSVRSKVYFEPIVLIEHTVLRFFAMDKLGNEEAVHQEEFFFDTTPPRTVAEPPAGEYAPPITVRLSTEEGARIHFTTDGIEPDTDSPLYSEALTFRKPTDLRVFAVDRAGNREKTQHHQYRLLNGVWRKHLPGVFLIPSVTDGKWFWMGTEDGLIRYRVGSGNRQFLGPKDGLLGSRVNDLILDEKGDLWVATDEGLNRYRGTTFTSFSRDDGLPVKEVLCLAADTDGTIWAGTKSGVVHLVGDMVLETFTTRLGLPDNAVLSIAVDAAGNKWFGTRAGVAKFTGKEWDTYNTASGLVSNEIRTIAVDSNWRVWVGTDKGISVLEGERWNSYTKARGLPSDTIQLIAPDPDGEVWVATPTGVVRFNKGKWTRVDSP